VCNASRGSPPGFAAGLVNGGKVFWMIQRSVMVATSENHGFFEWKIMGNHWKIIENNGKIIEKIMGTIGFNGKIYENMGK
jgi:hypothetical protein